MRVAIAPRDHRNATRIPPYRRRPLSWSWRPIVTLTPPRQLGVVGGTQRTFSSRGTR
jgi:hypothetical protein